MVNLPYHILIINHFLHRFIFPDRVRLIACLLPGFGQQEPRFDIGRLMAHDRSQPLNSFIELPLDSILPIPSDELRVHIGRVILAGYTSSIWLDSPAWSPARLPEKGFQKCQLAPSPTFEDIIIRVQF